MAKRKKEGKKTSSLFACFVRQLRIFSMTPRIDFPLKERESLSLSIFSFVDFQIFKVELAIQIQIPADFASVDLKRHESTPRPSVRLPNILTKYIVTCMPRQLAQKRVNERVLGQATPLGSNSSK